MLGGATSWVQASDQGQARGCVFQDSDLKQYLDHCGNLMSMHNVKVRTPRLGSPAYLGLHRLQSPAWKPG